MTWDAYHRRQDALRDVLALADGRSEPSLDDLLETVPGARQAYPDPDLALLDAQMAFVQRVRGGVDLALGDDLGVPATDREELVVQAWAQTADQMPGARALLDAAESDGRLEKAFAKERAILAGLAGSTVHGPHLLEHGDRIRRKARRRITHRAGDVADAVARQGLFGRLRDALAA